MENHGVLIIKADITQPIVFEQLPEGKTLEFLQGRVGGLIERVPFPVDGVDAYINEEGKFAPFVLETGEIVSGLPVNELATALMHEHGLLFPGDYVAGDMVLVSSDGDGETVGLTGEQGMEITQMLITV